MNFISTEIEGVFIIEPRVFGDERGYFLESFSERDFAAATGLEVLFAFLYLQKKQDRISELFNIGFLNK